MKDERLCDTVRKRFDCYLTSVSNRWTLVKAVVYEEGCLQHDDEVRYGQIDDQIIGWRPQGLESGMRNEVVYSVNIFLRIVLRLINLQLRTSESVVDNSPNQK